ncbi:MAG: DUF1592 domain-containing protein [Bryobacterales bacterium]|nr:DUF1592 domain-containing protein [Bryobacterales bacterium]
MAKWAILACFAIAGLGVWSAQPQAAAPPHTVFVRQYCVGCHGAKSPAGGFTLTGIAAETPLEHAEAWEKAVRRLRARSMPPAGAPRPDEAAYEAVLRFLESRLDAGAVNPGRTDTFRRLNRTEYRNAIRDLLALDVEVDALLPADESSHGFDNVTVGDLPPLLLERYLGAARRISRLAVGLPGRSPGGDTFHLPADLTQEEHFDGLPLGTRGGTAVGYTFPMDGEYEIVVRLARDRNEHVEGLRGRHEVEIGLDGQRVGLFSVEPPPPGKDHSLVDEHLRVRLTAKAGPHTVTATFPRRTGALRETERQPYEAHFNMDRHPRPQPAVYSLTVNGPYTVGGPGDSPSRRRIFVCRPASAAEEDACAGRILAALLRRAFRRPVTAADVAAPLRFYREARAVGDFDHGVEMALRAVLVSPEFLFRVERDPPGAAPASVYRISDLELASRLSFFLWSSIPDDELLAAAERGDLHEPAVLERQVRRLLGDPRSSALATNFAGQWLHLRNLASATPDMRLFPGFDDNLRQAMRRETELFFESIQREDRSALDLLRADYTYLNGRLAKHYGIPNVYGSRFRRVAFGQERMRGGLLRHGSVLTVTSYATRTSPVIRGKWIMENLLGTPPPPPPPAVPALQENGGVGKTRTVRERLAAHRENPACAGCHRLIDPPGFSLENFDAVGRWRDFEDGIPVDASGGLPDGSVFEGIDGLETALLRRPELFATTLSEKLLTYALGRGMEHTDAPAVRQIVREARDGDFRFSSFVLGIAGSAPFQMRRAQ